MARKVLLCVLVLMFGGVGHAAESLTIAVASSYQEQAFRQVPSRQIKWVIGASGRLSGQIQRGAPYDLFISADVAFARAFRRPRRVIGVGRVGMRLGKRVVADAHKLLSRRIRRLVMPDPRVAPVGAMARSELLRRGLWEPLRPKIVYVRNALQAKVMVDRGWVDGGFVTVGPDQPCLGEVHYILVLLSNRLGARRLFDAWPAMDRPSSARRVASR